ncbi:polysaccharide deacetylase family protein [Dactylosporangium matsuzakiense]|uniref:Polysaccharide deacetylase n=1 Tax=Dactylosporangium matsuzakiense TaxID=53360 RepID=A0A9W6KKW7_9ACTN|nr:polysaccharide deacetylase family protein [Dactylosporangium matsuzakiense]UWZ41536.1 polysaccharide deacetylase family protein [Dactylosporangium matsuzakiense]GLL02404.1 polysaccharide deacetylase [Dactylosporangium matsuzakiense]
MIVLAVLAVAAALGVSYWLLMSPFSPTSKAYPYQAPTASSGEKVVALTFDDGPNEPYTSQILDILADHGVRATFFQVGDCVQRHPEVALRVLDEGHVVGNHSLSHRFGTYLRPRAFEREVEQTQRILTGVAGRTPALARTPWLWRQPALLRMLHRNGLNPVAGEFGHALEVFQISGARMARRAIAKTRPGSILIFHDGFDGHGGNRAETVTAVRLTVEGLLARGYRFVTVDELLGVPAYLQAA